MLWKITFWLDCFFVQSTVAAVNVIDLLYMYEHMNYHYLLVNWN